jgi:hypothetical protein
VAPEIPVEEVVFLAFLSYLALVCATGVATAVEHLSRSRSGARADVVTGTAGERA